MAKSAYLSAGVEWGGPFVYLRRFLSSDKDLDLDLDLEGDHDIDLDLRL